VLRSCSNDYLLKDEDIGKTFLIARGTDVFIPLDDIQNDPKYFPDPERFDPLRFSDDNKSKIVPGSYLPFGMGPRFCIGSRFGLLEAKLLLYTVLSAFKIEKSPRTPERLTIAKGVTGYEEKIFVTLKLRK
jgi:cytochrome P450 family 9